MQVPECGPSKVKIMPRLLPLLGSLLKPSRADRAFEYQSRNELHADAEARIAQAPKANEESVKNYYNERRVPVAEVVHSADAVGPYAPDQGFAGNCEWEILGGAGAFSAASKTAGARSTSWDADGADWATSSAPAQTSKAGSVVDELVDLWTLLPRQESDRDRAEVKW